MLQQFEGRGRVLHVEAVFLPNWGIVRYFGENFADAVRECDCDWIARRKVSGVPIELRHRQQFAQDCVPWAVPMVFEDFGAIAAFSSLLFADHGWTPVWLAFSAYAVSLIIARLAFGHLPDRIGGARVALLFSVIEAIGLALMSFASTGSMAAIGAALTGFGYSLVFPALGVEAVRRAPGEGRGVAMGAYTACLDLALGVSGPVLGAVASRTGLSAVFFVSALIVLSAAAVAMRLLRAEVRPLMR